MGPRPAQLGISPVRRVEKALDWPYCIPCAVDGGFPPTLWRRLFMRRLLAGGVRATDLPQRSCTKRCEGRASNGACYGRRAAIISTLTCCALLVEPLLIVRRVLHEQLSILHRRLLAIVRDDEVCRRLMAIPGVGSGGGADLA